MSKNVKEEWKQYSLEEGKEYTIEQLVEKFKYAVSYLKAKHVRIDYEMCAFPNRVNEKYHLSERDKQDYEKAFQNEGYAPQDCKKIVCVMDAVYHILDISKEEAGQFTLYVAEKHLTLTDALKKKYGLSVSECEEYMNTILMPYVDCCREKVFQSGKELMDVLLMVFDSKEDNNDYAKNNGK